MTSIRVNATIRIDNTGARFALPVLISNSGLLKSHLIYLLHHRRRSHSWLDRSAFAVKLLCDFWDANLVVCLEPKQLFREFALSLFTGTIGENGSDDSGLRWLPRREADARQLVALLTHYFDWLAEVNEDAGISLNPRVPPDGIGARMNLACYYHRKRNAFMSHLWANKPKNIQRFTQLPRAQVVSSSEVVKAFPQGKMHELLEHGFIMRGKSGKKGIENRLNLRDILITMLMYYGGLRVSECFHIWLEDIVLVDHQCVVKVHHPSQGGSPDKKFNRAAYLRQKYNLVPRTEYPKRNGLHSGWKDPLLTNNKGKYFTLHWFPASAGDQFRHLWVLYLRYQYVRPRPGSEHPYAFTNHEGRPYTIRAYTKSRKRAVERIGLRFSKSEGTTAHADRHSYGLSLANAKVRPEVIKVAMHHKSIDSQEVYTQPSANDVRRALDEAMEALEVFSENLLEAGNE
ncbi:site-specific integrase [Pseudomonas neustonica]|uniref:Site-specific integrase n=1 Tax=Pseudomonas neustonica TaxID=2487346 RepID=A0ABX9XCE4_9PSED|nr:MULTISPECIES: gamma-mobile-trio recombinase GmtY [Pseudomonas]ROZ79281.1 site-specific integrase [Pseudomonas sp. SSM44]ROZ80212.1 site-specific integrase [Pseudomonas neustonica]